MAALKEAQMLLVIVHLFNITLQSNKIFRHQVGQHCNHISSICMFGLELRIQVKEVVRLRGEVKEWEGQGDVCRQVKLIQNDGQEVQ